MFDKLLYKLRKPKFCPHCGSNLVTDEKFDYSEKTGRPIRKRVGIRCEFYYACFSIYGYLFKWSESIKQHPDFGSCSLCGGEVEFGKMAEHENTCGVICPECKGSNVIYDGVQVIMNGNFNSYQCDDCGKCFTKPANGEQLEIG